MFKSVVLPPRKTPPSPSRFQVVPRQTRSKADRLRWIGIFAVLWLLSLLAVGWLTARYISPPPEGLEEALNLVAQQRVQIEELKQKQATLEASEQISRAANSEVQTTLVERDEEIASLRADVAFYERLVGATSQRRGLNAHSVEFAAETAGTWHYSVVLTQNLNRGAISNGHMRFSIEGVQGGKLTTLEWDALHQKPNTPGQDYSFRYFQQLNGSIMLPEDFTPQRVRISLSGSGGNNTQTFDWKTTENNT